MRRKRTIKEYSDFLEQLGLLVKADIQSCCNLIGERLTCDSREVSDGTIFICKGKTFRKEYLISAVGKGAVCYVSEEDYGLPGLIQVRNIRRVMAELSGFFFDYPWRKYPLAGITGTKGKSTTLAFLAGIMEKAAVCGEDRFGYISTIDTYDGINRFESHLTTPESVELGQRLSNIAESGLYAAGMEVSSQALKYERTYGVEFEIACFTNFGLDHIGQGEHSDIEDYLSSKLKIFSQCRKAVINLDSDRIDNITAAAEKSLERDNIVTISAKDKAADYFISDIRRENGRTLFELSGLGTVALTMPGRFNAYNAAMAAAAAKLLGASEEEIKAGLLYARADGRMELFENKERQIAVISDYAHNGLSFESLCRSVKEDFPGYRIEAVFGASGGKGLSRRTELPRVAAQYTDYCYLTEDDPAMEDPMDISRVLYDNLISFGGKGEIVINREEAITKAVKNASPKTVVLLLAKGRESYLIHGTDYDDYISDSALAEKLTR